jgi:hypothetical protein
MRTFVGVALLTAAFALSGCANHPDLPIAQTICVEVAQETPTEVAYVKRKAAEYIGPYYDYGFRVVESGCEVQVKYDQFGGYQGETAQHRGFWISRNGYWSQEGIVTVTAGGKVLEQDRAIALRGYGTKQELLDALAWQIVRPVTWHFQTKPSQKR